MTTCAIQYDSNHPSALKLTSFDCLTLNAHMFKEALRQTFNLHLNPREHGALFRHFCRREDDWEIDSKEFLNVFLQVRNRYNSTYNSTHRSICVHCTPLPTQLILINTHYAINSSPP